MENNSLSLGALRLLNIACNLAETGHIMGRDSDEYKVLAEQWDKVSSKFEAANKAEPKRIYTINPIDHNTLNSDIKFFYFSVFEPDDERSESELYIWELAKQKKDKGVYMIYEDNQVYDLAKDSVISNHDEILPIYIGRTCSFVTRMWQHRQSRSDVLQRYMHALDSDEWISNNPIIGLHVDFWLIDSAEERKFKEHELIGKYRPPFNKQ